MAQANNQAAGKSWLEKLAFDIGQSLGQALAERVKGVSSPASTKSVAAAPARRGPGRPPRSAAEAACIVPGCSRRSVAKKLCPTHYRKAGRLNMTGTLTESQLALLARDGRAVRWENAAKAKKAPAPKPAKPAKPAAKSSKKAGKSSKK
jgi:hypothetical protein